MTRALPLLLLLVACSGAPSLDDAGTPDAAVQKPDAGEGEIIAAHNAVRARAMPAPMPPLSAMSWHDGAAAAAAAWVERCEYGHNSAIQGMYGENLFATTAPSARPTEVVESWASEAPNYDLAMNRCTGVCGHYTQIVWRSSTGVGCASKLCTTGAPPSFPQGPWLYWVCDYAPPGNFVGQRPY